MGKRLYLARARGRAYLSAAKKSLWPCMCEYLLPLGTPRRLRLLHLPPPLPPPPLKSAEIQAAGRGPSSDCALAHRQTSCPVFTGSLAEAREHRHSFLYFSLSLSLSLSISLFRFSSFFLFSLARYQPCRVYVRHFTPREPRLPG